MGDDAFKKALEDKREIELTVTGRRTGRESSRPVWFVRDADSVYLVPVTGSDSNWYKNVLANPTIRLSVDPTQITAQARPVEDRAKRDEVLDKLRAKYGAEEVERDYPKQDAAVEVPLS